jgi:hypothetical protein
MLIVRLGNKRARGLLYKAAPEAFSVRRQIVEGTAWRPWKLARTRSSLALLISLLILSSFFVIAGAQIAAAQTCGVDISCHLVFRGQPHAAVTGRTITTTDFNPEGARVQVEAQDDAGNVMTLFTGTITLKVASSSVPPSEIPKGGVDDFFSGKTADAVGGVATFGSLSSSHSGTFTLRASTGLTSSDPSDSFTIWDKRCQQGTPCVVSKPNSMTAAVNTSAAGIFLLSLNADAIDCGDSFNHAPGTVTVDSTSSETKVVTITIAKSVVKATPNNGVRFYQVCYQADHSFTTRDGTPATEAPPGTFTGLLPDCPPMPTAADAPCILSKSKNKAGNVIIAVLLPAGDPKVH